jgi:Fe-S-cluster containining protein
VHVNAWQCHKSGDCCRSIRAIRMTHQEAAKILERTAGKELQWRAASPYGFVELVAQPCPLLAGNSCSVYEVRPFNCRRFMCFRDEGEAFDSSGPLGCKNLSDRVEQDRPTRRAYLLNERKAQKWALRHGWTGRE